MLQEMDKVYEPQKIEEKIYQQWEKSGFFKPEKSKGRKKFVIYMPLPNITGSLHIGHALNNTLQDILARYHRMKGDETLWLPGTDHAGISAQYVVDKKLRKEGVSRWQLGREKFVEKIWEWKKEYGEIIVGQLKKLGVSADWSRFRFTLDPAYILEVKKAFIHYYEKGLIYRGSRPINWCSRCATSLSDLELDYTEETSRLWHIRYPIAGQPGQFIIVATTRPETMLGDTAVAVNPKDERYKKLAGQKAVLPIMNREIPIITDQVVDPKFGTGAVKVTPAHDLTDFEIGQRHNLPLIKIADERNLMTEAAGEFFGLKTIEAREKILAILHEKNLIDKIEDLIHSTPHCARCQSAIETLPSPQWFLKMDKLAANTKKIIKNGRVKITPKRFEKTFYGWLDNIRDWNISRQLWWGHQLPVFFCENDKEKYIVALNKPKKCSFCKNCEMKQSEDVLDTWFSAALWPFAELSKKDLKEYYPGNVVITARDIINHWISRMIFSGLEFHKKPPFQNVVINGTILNKEGKRMSKSLGTGVDPLEYMKNYGADALRFAVVWQAFGQDIKWDENAVIAGRKFTNKIWNASRYVLTNIPLQINADKKGLMRIKNLTSADRKILKELAVTKTKIEKDINKFEFSPALHSAYDFFWHSFCDRYLEISKKQLESPKLKANTEKVLIFTLKESMKMLHPFLPFITEEIYQKIPPTGRQVPNKKKLLISETWAE
ncbi:MAG: valine--tRNA ligase [bacterium]|nr:valine--tRNA ligase [bacterium]